MNKMINKNIYNKKLKKTYNQPDPPTPQKGEFVKVNCLGDSVSAKRKERKNLV